MNPLRVLVVPDKLKGTLSAHQAADALCRGWLAVRPDDVLDVLPMADGGDGFGEVFGALLGADARSSDTRDAAGRPRGVTWWRSAAGASAVLEAAQVNGMALFSSQSHPFELDTFGVGDVLRSIVSARVNKIYVGLGGSATNDGGFGLARALGWTFRGVAGVVIERWTQLDTLVSIEAPTQMLNPRELIIAVDVNNPLLGTHGATYTYGMQKGLSTAELAHVEACLARLAAVVRSQLGLDVAAEPGAGSAGGLGFGLRVFAAGRLQSGAELFSLLAALPERVAAADVVLTAEGSFDAQSLMGKGVGLVAALASQAGKHCICVAGRVLLSTPDTPWPSFRSYAIVPQWADLTEARSNAALWVQRVAAQAASDCCLAR